MFSLNSVNKAKLEAAVERARSQKPLIREIEFGRYKVLASDGESRYNVEYKKLDGEVYATCTCKGSKGACYHVAATLGHFKMQLVERARNRQQTLINECELYG